jgi:hypothetical protein
MVKLHQSFPEALKYLISRSETISKEEQDADLAVFTANLSKLKIDSSPTPQYTQSRSADKQTQPISSIKSSMKHAAAILSMSGNIYSLRCKQV